MSLVINSNKNQQGTSVERSNFGNFDNAFIFPYFPLTPRITADYVAPEPITINGLTITGFGLTVGDGLFDYDASGIGQASSVSLKRANATYNVSWKNACMTQCKGGEIIGKEIILQFMISGYSASHVFEGGADIYLYHTDGTKTKVAECKYPSGTQYGHATGTPSETNPLPIRTLVVTSSGTVAQAGDYIVAEFSFSMQTSSQSGSSGDRSNVAILSFGPLGHSGCGLQISVD